MWCMMPGHINGPHFFKGSASAISYAEMLEVWLIPQPRDSGLLDYVWPQNNSSYIFCLSVCNTLNEHSVSCQTGHASTSPTPLSWPSFSPDLTIWTTLCTALSMNKWLCTAVTIMSCTEMWNRLGKSHKCFSTGHISHGSALWCV